MNTAHKPKADFDQRYQTHLKHLKLKGLQPQGTCTPSVRAHAGRTQPVQIAASAI